MIRTNVRQLVRVLGKLNDSNLFAVLVHARLLVLRECVVEQYHLEQRRAVPVMYAAHWVGQA